MISFELKMGVPIVGLAWKKVAIGAQLQKVQDLGHQLERKEKRVTIKRATRSELEVEVAQKEQITLDLTKKQNRESALSTVIEKLQREVVLLKDEMVMFKEKSLKLEEEALLVQNELPKRLKKRPTDAVKKFGQIKEFELFAALWIRSTLVSVFNTMSKDILKVNAQFPLHYLPSRRDFLALQTREAEASKASEEEGSDNGSDISEKVTFPSSPKGTPDPTFSSNGCVTLLAFAPEGCASNLQVVLALYFFYLLSFSRDFCNCGALII